MKTKVTKKLFCIVGAWLIAVGIAIFLPSMNLSCNNNLNPSNFPPANDEGGGSDFNIHLNGGISALGEGGHGGFINVTVPATGRVDIGGPNPGIPDAPDASGAPGPDTAGACVIQGTVTFSSLDGSGAPCDTGVGGDDILLPNNHVIIDGVLVLDGPPAGPQ